MRACSLGAEHYRPCCRTVSRSGDADRIACSSRTRRRDAGAGTGSRGIACTGRTGRPRDECGRPRCRAAQFGA
jgi:hypothetical protein